VTVTDQDFGADRTKLKRKLQEKIGTEDQNEALGRNRRDFHSLRLHPSARGVPHKSSLQCLRRKPGQENQKRKPEENQDRRT
jgi:hypothetical protein